MPFQTISERAFDGLNNLERLNLEDNRLKTLEGGLFKEMPALSYLNLMRNSLETVTLHTIQPLMNNLVNHTGMLHIKGNFAVAHPLISDHNQINLHLPNVHNNPL